MEYKILDYFVFSKSQSAYGIFKEIKAEATKYGRIRSSSYKDVHKRVKRLEELKLIEQISGHFERGAKHYRITPYGLITNLDIAMDVHHEFIVNNKENVVIQSLLLQFLEEPTIDSFYLLKEFPTRNIGNYLYECGSITRDTCKNFWINYDRYKLTDILPSDNVIQKYMAHLDGKFVDQSVINEVKKYGQRLEKRLEIHNDKSEYSELARAVYLYDNRYFSPQIMKYYEMRSDNPFNKAVSEESPPFPLLEIYYDIVVHLSTLLKEKIKLLAFKLVSQLGYIISDYKIKDKKDLEEELLEEGRDYSLKHILKDKKIIDLINDIKVDFDAGYKQFMYYHKLPS